MLSEIVVIRLTLFFFGLCGKKKRVMERERRMPTAMGYPGGVRGGWASDDGPSEAWIYGDMDVWHLYTILIT